MNAIEMDNLVLRDEVDETEVPIHLQSKFVCLVGGNDPLHHVIEEESQVSLEEKVGIELEEGVPFEFLASQLGQKGITLP